MFTGLMASRLVFSPEPSLEVSQLSQGEFPSLAQPLWLNGRPRLAPLPDPDEVWECQVVVVGGSLGGVAAASHAMQSGAQTCLIEVAPWLGGQMTSQGVAALDESLLMRQRQNFSLTWEQLRQKLEDQTATLPEWSPGGSERRVADINQCWVGTLCFPPTAGVSAVEALLQEAVQASPGSRWGSEIAFKGASFDATGQVITAIHAVRRMPKDPHYVPIGRLSAELAEWYSWSETETFERSPLRLQAPAGQEMIVIDATDTGELVGWAQIPYRLGSESVATTGEPNGAEFDNPDCTQAFTYPFAIALHDDSGDSLAALSRLETAYALHEHLAGFSLEGFPMFGGKSVFHYRRLVSHTRNNPYYGYPALGDITLINWNPGNDWNWMNPPLVMSAETIERSGQRQNWLGGLSQSALQFAEDHALMFGRWLLETQSTPETPLTYLYGGDSPMGTLSGLSMVPYFREGRRILGRSAYGQTKFQIRENDLRRGFPEQREFKASAVGITHYAVDIHGCRYRNWLPSGDAVSAPAQEPKVRPLHIPLESLIPRGVDNLLMGGKAIAATHIANAVTRIHYSEWQIGAAAGATAGWLAMEPEVATAEEILTRGKIETLQAHLVHQGLRLEW